MQTKLVRDLEEGDNIVLEDGSSAEVTNIEKMPHCVIEFACGGGAYSLDFVLDRPDPVRCRNQWYGGNQEVEVVDA